MYLNKNTYRKEKEKIIIIDNNEQLVEIPKSFDFFEPHPYISKGADYNNKSPYFVRERVLRLLQLSQDKLNLGHKGYKLKIFDALRPLNVQKHMIEYENNRLSNEIYNKDFKLLNLNDKIIIRNLVLSFWSPISSNIEKNPPPHSTGGALDLTIVDENGKELNMGTNIDDLSEKSHSDYFELNKSFENIEIINNRNLLCDIMNYSGFVQLPTEWWHFSYGDQIWAINESKKLDEVINAKYGIII